MIQYKTGLLKNLMKEPTCSYFLYSSRLGGSVSKCCLYKHTTISVMYAI